jgi:hypothetical protein
VLSSFYFLVFIAKMTTKELKLTSNPRYCFSIDALQDGFWSFTLLDLMHSKEMLVCLR